MMMMMMMMMTMTLMMAMMMAMVMLFFMSCSSQPEMYVRDYTNGCKAVAGLQKTSSRKVSARCVDEGATRARQ